MRPDERVADPLDQSTARENMRPSRAMIVGATLEVTRGPDAGLVRTLREPTLTIGKGSLSGLRLSDPTVSREHVRLELSSAGVVVRDGGSTNGTWLGGVRIEKVVVTSDTALQVGGTTIAIGLDAAPSEIDVSATDSFGAAYARSLPMRHLFALLVRAAASDISILLEGESGVGKEVIARGIHDHSPRAAGPFVAVDCAAIPPNLIESELFGHERGAFTGADRMKLGLFEEASGGTVFLDELGELPLASQPKLLRVVQQQEVRRVGSRKARPIDVRVVAATNRDLMDQCAQGTFREDLFYRVAALRLRVPSLRERIDDIAPLATRFLRELRADPRAELPADILAMLTAYSWPGNVRELRNVVMRFALLDAYETRFLFDAKTVAHGARSGAPGSAPQEDLSAMSFHDARQVVIEQFEASYFPAVLKRASGNVTRAAELAKIARSSFYRLLMRHGAVGAGRIDD